MKRIRRLPGVLLFVTSISVSATANVPVSFNLAVDPSGVALQFDVTSDDALGALGAPSFDGASEHEVRSATLASGAHRFVVFSPSGDPISATGEVSVVFSPSLEAKDGAIAIDNVTASDASGEVVAAAPNALPVLAFHTRERQSVEVGRTVAMDPTAFDLDGAMQRVALLSGDDELAAAEAAPFALSWTPASAGSFLLSLAAVDSADAQRVFDLGTFRAFEDSELTDFDAFASIHFGSDSPFDADPLNSGIRNGLAYLLGINPHRPDRSRLPVARLLRTESGVELVTRFTRRSNLSDVAWSALSSADLMQREALPAERISESDQGDGTHTVEIRLPLDPSSATPTFVNLEVSPSP